MVYVLNETYVITLPYKDILKKIKPNSHRSSDHVEHQTFV